MADFPTDLTNAVDNTTDVLAKHLNNLEAKVGVDDSTVKTTLDFLLKAQPEGHLINGKIVPSVASNNLTVALKGMDGNDASSSNPIFVRIGDTIHKITSALSVTKNAGTNWFNAGSSELATYEIDYFVYLGYNATDGVVIGFARIPYATDYSQFSATTTAESYCAISTITNATSGDDYVVIGRFGATLSAGAGYTWSVPTFTSINLFQRPIFETRWLTWQPTYTCSGSMTYTTVTTNTAKYMIRRESCLILLFAKGTTGGSASSDIIASPPITSAEQNQPLSARVIDGGNAIAGISNISTNGNIQTKRHTADNWGLGANRYINVRGEFLYS